MPLNGPAKDYPKIVARRRFDFDEAKRRYEGGETTVQIAQSYGVSSNAVRLALKRMGVRLIPQWKRPVPNPGFRPLNEAKKAQTHCRHGHEFTPENTIIRSWGGRECVACQREHVRRQRANERARGFKREKWGMHLKPERFCRNCGSSEHLELHHAVPRRKAMHLRADLRNGLPLCRRCHSGWHSRKVIIPRSVFRAEEWEFLSSFSLTGESMMAWLERRYPLERAYGLEYGRGGAAG